MSESYLHTFAAMGTVVSVHVVGHGETPAQAAGRASAVERASAWFTRVESCCNRFDEQSELRRLSARVGESQHVSDLLFETLQFALRVAEDTDGAFDPTVGAAMEERGFDRDYRSGANVASGIRTEGSVSFRDVTLDAETHSVTIARPLLLDLSAVAKGLAVDLAARELQPFANFVVDAGGDLYLAGQNGGGEAWSVGIRHPREPGALIGTVRVSDAAVCTSGDYERASPLPKGGHHIVDPRTSRRVGAKNVSDAERDETVASVTVIAPSAIVADALATAAFVLGPDRGLAFLDRNGVDGLIVTPSLGQFSTEGMHRALDHRDRPPTVAGRA